MKYSYTYHCGKKSLLNHYHKSLEKCMIPIITAKQSHNTPMEVQGREDVQLLLIHNLSTRWEWVLSVMPWPRFTPGKGPLVPTVQEAGWAPEPVWTHKLQGKISCLCQGLNLNHQVIQSIARLYTDWATLAPDNCYYNIHLYHQYTQPPLKNPTLGILVVDGRNVLGQQMALVHPSQCMRHCAEGCMALSW
jgi:hypothetical protein